LSLTELLAALGRRLIAGQSGLATIGSFNRKEQQMNKLRKIVLTAAALGALAVGGAAFAQAQNGSSTPAPVQQSGSQAGTTDTDPGQSADTGTDRGEGGAEQASDASDAHESHDAIGGHEVEDGD
jgi:hypothetical protein